MLTHFPPGDTYNNGATVESALKEKQNYSQRGVCPESLMLFGHGDGGGGPQVLVCVLPPHTHTPQSSSHSLILSFSHSLILLFSHNYNHDRQDGDAGAVAAHERYSRGPKGCARLALRLL